MLDKHGYQNTWYDALNMDEQNHLYFFTPPKTEGNLYFTVETYYQDIVPEQCIKDSPTPIVSWRIDQNLRTFAIRDLHVEQVNVPVLVQDTY